MAFNGFNSTAFMSYIQKNNGLAEGYRFIVSIPALANDELLQFMCKEAIIPGKEIEIMEKTYGYGTTRQLPKSEKYENVNLKLQCTNGKNKGGYPEWNYFYDWMENVVQTGTNIVGYREDYIEDVHINTFNRGNQLVHHTILPNTYPIKVGDISLSMEQKEVEFEVTLACDYVLHNKMIGRENSAQLAEHDFNAKEWMRGTTNAHRNKLGPDVSHMPNRLYDPSQREQFQ